MAATPFVYDEDWSVFDPDHNHSPLTPLSLVEWTARLAASRLPDFLRLHDACKSLNGVTAPQELEMKCDRLTVKWDWRLRPPAGTWTDISVLLDIRGDVAKWHLSSQCWHKSHDDQARVLRVLQAASGLPQQLDAAQMAALKRLMDCSDAM